MEFDQVKEWQVDNLEKIGLHDHMAFIYKDEKKHRVVVAKYFAIGLSRNERCIYISQQRKHKLIIKELESIGIDTNKAISNKSLVFASSQDTFAHYIASDSDYALKSATDALTDARNDGFAAIRAATDMNWIADDKSITQNLAEYEACINIFLSHLDVIILCLYNRNRFAPEFISEIFQTHPKIYINSKVCENTHYISPEQYLNSNKASCLVDNILSSTWQYHEFIKNLEQSKSNLVQTEQNLAELSKIKSQTEESLRKERDFNAAIFETVGCLLMVLDRSGRIIKFNQTCENVTGYKFEEVKDKPFWDILIMPEERKAAIQIFKNMYRGHFPLHYDNHWVCKNGSHRMISWSNTSLLTKEGKVEHVIGTGIDITARQRTENALKSAEARYRRLVEQIPAVIYISGLNENLSPFYISPQIENFTGFSDYEWTLNPEMRVNCIHPDDRDRVLAEQISCVKNKHGLKVEYRIISKDGSIVWISDESVIVYDEESKLTYVQGILTDITQRKMFEKQIDIISNHDLLTNLPNRAMLTKLLDKKIEQAKQYDKQLAVLSCDLDQFKLVNDTLGHSTGDILIIKVSERLQNSVREADTFARTGGDEFVIVLSDIKHEGESLAIGNRIIDSLAKIPFHVENQELFSSVSIGISIFPNDGMDAEELIKNADTAMYHAKEKGRSRCHLYTDTMNVDALERITLENGLRKALERNEFALYYQPKVSLKTGKIIGLEALIRWINPTMGVVSPNMFIPAAEENGMIVPISKWVIKQACEQNKAWQNTGLPKVEVSVNVSVQQFQNDDLLNTVKEALSETGLLPKYLTLELTESTLMKDPGHVVQTLLELKKIGVMSSIDDFGTGHSSLTYIRKLPISTIKVDRSFISEIDKTEDDRVIAHVVAQMAHTLKLGLIAEGVETYEQLAVVKSLGYNAIQGYLFSKPLPANELEKIFYNKLDIEQKNNSKAA